MSTERAAAAGTRPPMPDTVIMELSGNEAIARWANGTTLTRDTTDHGGVFSAACTAMGGSGTLKVREGFYTAEAGSPFLGKPGLVIQGMGWNVDSGFHTPTGGTIFQGPSGSSIGGNGAVLEALDCPKFETRDIGFDARGQSPYPWMIAGRASGQRHCGFFNGTTAQLFYTENNATPQQSYVDMFCDGGFAHGGGAAVKGLLVNDKGGTHAQPSDGHIGGDFRVWGCHTRHMEIDKGGWKGSEFRIVGDTSSASGLFVLGGDWTNFTVDSMAGPYVEVGGSAVKLDVKCLLASSGHLSEIVKVSGGSVIDIGTILVFDAASGSQDYDFILNFTSTPVGRAISWNKLLWKIQPPNTAACSHMTPSGDYALGISGGHS